MKKNIAFSLTLAAGLFIITASVPAAHQGPHVIRVSTTSTLEPSKRTYTFNNLMDGTGSSWCEGKKGDGIGESITLHLDGKKRIHSFYIKNGFGIKKYFAANNRIKSLSVNGIPCRLKDSGAFQKVTLKRALTTDKLELKIASVYRGTRYRDTCIAEVSFDAPSKMKNFGRKNAFHRLEKKQYDCEGTLPGSALSFNRDMTIISEWVPCGDETCPNINLGYCSQKTATTWLCRFVKNCYGTCDYTKKPFKVKRVCKPLGVTFTLTLKGGAPFITVKGKKKALRTFDR